MSVVLSRIAAPQALASKTLTALLGSAPTIQRAGASAKLAILAIAALVLFFAFSLTTPALAEDSASSRSASSSSASPATSVDESSENLVDPTQRADNSFIYDTTIGNILEQSSLYEGRTVQVVGEVIGDRIVERDARCWITLTESSDDDPATISVLMSNDQANQIDRYGRYGVVGTTLQVRGIFQQACSEHDGLPDIHATNSSVLSRGIDQPDEFNPHDFVPGVLAILAGVLLMGVFYFVRERAR